MTHEYKLLYGDTPEALSAQVNEALADGWDLWGNPFWARVPGYYSIGEVNKYCQAAVRLVEEKAESVSAGYTVSVPVLEEFSPIRIPVSELETVINARPVFCFNLPLCTCGKEMDPDCEFHKLHPFTNLVF